MSLMENFFVIYCLGTISYIAGKTMFSIINTALFAKKRLVILRGLPGSGKTSYIKHYIEENDITTYSICSAFYHFKRGLVYRFNPRQLPQAYHSSWKDFLEATMNGCPNIFVNNTNVRKWEYENYIYVGQQLGYDIEIVQIDCPGSTYVEFFQKRSRHRIPIQASRAMAERWQDDSSAKIVSCYDSDDEGEYIKVPDTISEPYFNANDSPDPEKLDNELDEYHQRAKEEAEDYNSSSSRGDESDSGGDVSRSTDANQNSENSEDPQDR